MAARHNIITGLPARYHGFDDNYFDDNPKVIPYDLPTFPQLLSDAGYDTIAVGKMHFQPYRRHNGITKLELMDEIPRHRQDDEYALYLKEHGYGDIQSIHGVRHLLYMLPQRSMLPEELHGSSWVSNRSIHHIKENAGKRPFFLWSSFIAPHPPFDVPDQWADLYKGKTSASEGIQRPPLSALAEENNKYPGLSDGSMRRADSIYTSISFVTISENFAATRIWESTIIRDHFHKVTTEMLGTMGHIRNSFHTATAPRAYTVDRPVSRK